MEKKLYRSNTNKMLCGVCGGIGEYFNIDPTIVRLIWAIFICSGRHPGLFHRGPYHALGRGLSRCFTQSSIYWKTRGSVIAHNR